MGLNFNWVGVVNATEELREKGIPIKTIITEEIAKTIADAPEDFDTLKEIADWIETHADSASAMNTAIKANTEAIKENSETIEELKENTKAKLEYVTLAATDWVDSSITVYSNSIQESSIITLNLGNSLTEEQLNAILAAKIVGEEQGNGYIKLKALGEVPKINVQLCIFIQGNLVEAESNIITDTTTGEKYQFEINDGTLKLKKI